MIDEWNQYLSGDVYGFKLLDENQNEIDSCWGFYGSDILTNGICDYIDNEFSEYIKDNK